VLVERHAWILLLTQHQATAASNPTPQSRSLDPKEVSLVETTSAVSFTENATKSALRLDDLGPDILYLICEQVRLKTTPY
jgi:hypothetical protein